MFDPENGYEFIIEILNSWTACWLSAAPLGLGALKIAARFVTATDERDMEYKNAKLAL